VYFLLKEELIEAMTFFSKDESMFLDRQTLENLILNLGEPLTRAETQEFLTSLSYNEDGKISFDDFIKIVMNKKNYK
jgi:Ca2+-binding EF-hand superfamily protein